MLGIFPIRINVRRQRAELDKSAGFYWRSGAHIFASLCIQAGLAVFAYISTYLYAEGRVDIIVTFFLTILTLLHADCMQTDYLTTWWIAEPSCPSPSTILCYGFRTDCRRPLSRPAGLPPNCGPTQIPR